MGRAWVKNLKEEGVLAGWVDVREGIAAEAARGKQSNPARISRTLVFFMGDIISPNSHGCKAQSNLLKSLIDFERTFDNFRVPLLEF